MHRHPAAAVVRSRRAPAQPRQPAALEPSTPTSATRRELRRRGLAGLRAPVAADLLERLPLTPGPELCAGDLHRGRRPGLGRALRVVRRQRDPRRRRPRPARRRHARAPAAAAREVVDDVRRLGAGEVVGVVNTHEHFDHTFGNGDLPRGVRRRSRSTPTRSPPSDRLGGRADQGAVRRRARRPAPRRGRGRPRSCRPTTRSPRRVVARPRRPAVELVHPGRGHTARRPGGPGARRRRAARRRPGRGVAPRRRSAPTRWPMEWPLSLDIVLGLITSAHRRRPRPRRAGRPRLRRGAAQRHRHRRRDDPRPRRPRRARSTRRSTPASGPARGSGSRPPYAAATSSSPAARSGCRSSERGTCLGA